ncbi:hypothetical protein VF13_37065 [Nostoc linckia z16]|nr:hypothetical protein VF13_37065 [Nostoc linckia z16]
MKKLLVVLLGTLFLAACSHDSEQAVPFDAGTEASTSLWQKDPVDPVLKQLYVTMINSKSYASFSQALNAFNSKLGDEIPDSELSSGSQMLTWVSGNLARTGFTSYAQAASEWDNVISLHSAVAAANNQFFNYLAGTAPGTLVPVLGSVQPVPTSCPKCTQQFLNCSAAADAAYASAVQSASNQLKAGTISEYSFSDKVSDATIALDRADSRCTRNYNSCCIGN